MFTQLRGLALLSATLLSVSAVNYKYLEQQGECQTKIKRGSFGAQMANIDKVRAVKGDPVLDSNSVANSNSSTTLPPEISDGSEVSEDCVCEPQIRIIIVLDETSSMKPHVEVTLEKYNNFLAKQKQLSLPEEIIPPKVTLVKFAQYLKIESVDDLSRASTLTNFNYKPNGSTALYDAVGCSINAYNKESNNILVIITDGAENSSTTFNRMQVKRLTDKVIAERGWDVQYLGANQDSFKTAGGLGITKAMNFRANAQGFTDIFEKLDLDLSQIRSQQYQSKTEKIRSRMRANEKIYKRVVKNGKVYFKRIDGTTKKRPG